MITALAHKITAFVLVFILFAHNINTMVIIGDFLVHQAVIAKNLCIQKDDQQGCNGKCQLTEQLKQNMPDSNTDVPTQETRRMSLDAFCLFKIEVVETSNHNIFHTPNNAYDYTKHLISRCLEVDTPPPNFS